MFLHTRLLALLRHIGHLDSLVRQIVAEAEETAERLQRDADDYCDRRLADFEIDLGKVLSQVQAGRAKLAGRLGSDEL